jgi:DNA uptake protein ComE-like DNA-binding protein
VQWALAGCGKKLAVVGFDACLMGMVEIATDMRNIADVMVASEELEPGAGWPYDKLLARIVANPAISTRDFAAGIVTDYNVYYSTRDSSTTLSAIDLTKIGALNTAIAGFVGAANQWAKIKAAREATRTYSEADGYPHADLGHFMANIATAGVTDPAVFNAAAAVRTALTAAVINNKFGSARTNSTGLAMFFPKTKTAYNAAEGADYPTHDFSVATGWNGFLFKYFTPPADVPVGGTTPPVTGDAKLLEYVNSPAVTTAMLDAVPYVSLTAAQRIVAYRATNRIDDVAELDAIAYVTVTMIDKLRIAAAAWTGGGTPPPPPPPVNPDAKLITYVNTAALAQLDAVSYVSTVAATNIVNYRATNRIDDVAELDAIAYVSVTMIDKLRAAADALP